MLFRRTRKARTMLDNEKTTNVTTPTGPDPSSQESVNAAAQAMCLHNQTAAQDPRSNLQVTADLPTPMILEMDKEPLPHQSQQQESQQQEILALTGPYPALPGPQQGPHEEPKADDKSLPVIPLDGSSIQPVQPELQYHITQQPPPQIVQLPVLTSGLHVFYRGMLAIFHSFTDPTQRSLAEQCVRLAKNLEQSQSECAQLSHDNRLKTDTISYLDDQLHQEQVKTAELRRQLESYKKECENVRKWGNQIQSQNEEFRTYIVDMETGLGPTHEEDYYKSQFERLKRLIEGDIVRYSRGNAKQILSDQAQNEILVILSKLGEKGVKSAHFLGGGQYPLSFLYSSNRWRHTIIRHIVSLFLFVQVFDGFAFGVSEEFSKNLQLVEQDILSREPQFVNVLMIHQAIGRGMKSVQTQKDIEIHQTIIAMELGNLLQLLLPVTPKAEVEATSKTIVEKAVALKQAMTEEHALYRIVLVECGESYSEDLMDVDDDEPTGPVFISTFPALTRTIKKDGKLEDIIIVKASVIMQTALEV